MGSLGGSQIENWKWVCLGSFEKGRGLRDYGNKTPPGTGLWVLDVLGETSTWAQVLDPEGGGLDIGAERSDSSGMEMGGWRVEGGGSRRGVDKTAFRRRGEGGAIPGLPHI